MDFNSRRSVVYSQHGMVAASQPLAVETGLQILRNGGNAVDAAIAVASVLNVTEPVSCGIGGDMFALYYDNAKKVVVGINGSGRSPKNLTLEKIRQDGITGFNLPDYHIHSVTVPGALAGFLDLLEKYGSKDRNEIFSNAIKFARNGFPVSPITAFQWNKGKNQLISGGNGEELLLKGHAPESGQIMKNPFLANTFEQIIEQGKDAFYKGTIADQIISTVQERGGLLLHEDLAKHTSEWVKSISIDYHDKTIHEIPPNGQGLTALLALNILEDVDFKYIEHLSSKYFHTVIDAMRLAFADTRYYIGDPEKVNVPVTELLSKKYAQKRRMLLHPNHAAIDELKGSPTTSSDTVYFTTADKEGNACSFIFSNYMGFGTGIIPKGCGFTLQNRGANFTLQDGHPNVLAPNKRPYHTIIPSMVTEADKNDFYASFGVMGGFMQPQGHVQVLLNMLEYGLNAQQALDVPRFCINDGTVGGVVSLEEGIAVKVMSELASKGHSIQPVSGHARSIFGRGQIIRKKKNDVYEAGSDPRADGLALGF
jgi:gamma-glutamyltranspeptidase/glutathione hydrolase